MTEPVSNPYKFTPRLIHGDCLEVMADIPDGSVDMVLTDPPYGTVRGAGLDGWGEENRLGRQA